MMDSVLRVLAVALIGCLSITSYFYREKAGIFEGKHNELMEAAHMNDLDGDGEAWVLVFLGE